MLPTPINPASVSIIFREKLFKGFEPLLFPKSFLVSNFEYEEIEDQNIRNVEELKCKYSSKLMILGSSLDSAVAKKLPSPENPLLVKLKKMIYFAILKSKFR